MNLQNAGPLGILASVLGLSFASGINLYLAVLTVGLSIRFGWVTGVPKELETLSHPAVLGLAGLLYVAEFIADKVPFVTPIWDAIHTIIRPIGGALLAIQTTGQLNPIVQAGAALLGGSIALGAHSSKAGLRLLAHASPEPASHSFISIAEDVGVVSLLVLAYNNPQIALVVLIGLLVLVAFFTPVLFRVLRFLVAGVAGRLRGWFGADASEQDVPDWVEQEIKRLSLPVRPNVVRCFARSGVTVSRLRDGYLLQADRQWWIVQKKLLRENLRPFGDGTVEQVSIQPGFVYDVLRFAVAGKSHSYYVAKDWTKAARRLLDSLPPGTRDVSGAAGQVSEAHS